VANGHELRLTLDPGAIPQFLEKKKEVLSVTIYTIKIFVEKRRQIDYNGRIRYLGNT